MLWLLSLPSLLPIPYLFHTKPSPILPRPFFKLDIELVCYCLFKKTKKKHPKNLYLLQWSCFLTPPPTFVPPCITSCIASLVPSTYPSSFHKASSWVLVCALVHVGRKLFGRSKSIMANRLLMKFLSIDPLHTLFFYWFLKFSVLLSPPFSVLFLSFQTIFPF